MPITKSNAVLVGVPVGVSAKGVGVFADVVLGVIEVRVLTNIID
jgi:hypothetical protein